MKSIKNTRALRRAIAQGHHEFALCLKYGLFSHKTITVRRDGRFRVENHIDGVVQTLSGRQLYTQSNIGEGMSFGVLLLYAPEESGKLINN